MADYSMYQRLGQGEQFDPNDPSRTSHPGPPQFRPPLAPQPYRPGPGSNAPCPHGGQFYGAPPPSSQSYGPPQGDAEFQPQPPTLGDGGLAGQMGAMSLGAE